MIDELKECRAMMEKIIAELDRVDQRLTHLERMTQEPPKADWIRLQEVSRHAQD